MARRGVIQAVLQLRDNMSGGLLQAAQNARRMGANIDRSMMQSTRRVVAFGNQLRTTATSAIKNFAKISAAAVGAAGTMAAKMGLAEAIDLEGYRLQLETATKDTEKAAKIMKYAIDLANNTPFEGGALVEGAAKFEAMGMSAQVWLTRAGDMAAATNKSFDQAVEALIDAQTGELERLKEFGITKAKILDKGEQMFAGVQLANNQGQIVNQEKFNEALISLMQDRFAGGMAKQATTMRGLWSTVTGVFKSSLAEIVGITSDGSVRTGSAFDLIKGKIHTLADTLAQWQQDGTISDISDKFTKSFQKVWDTASAAFAWIEVNIMPVASALRDAAAEAFAWAQDNILPTAEVLLGKVADALAWVADNMDKIAPILATLAKLWVGSKVAQFGMGVVRAGQDLWAFGGTVAEVVGNLPGLGDALSNIGTAGQHAMSALGNGARSAASFVGGLGGKILAAGKALLGLAAAHPVITGLIAVAVLIISNWDKVKAWFIAFGAKVKEIFTNLAGWASKKLEAIAEVAKTICDKIKSFFSSVGDFFTGIWENMKQTVSNFAGWINNKLEEIPILGNLYKGIKTGVGWVANGIGSMFGVRGSNALGTSYWMGGATRIHERGGEIMRLPSGTQIIPHDVSMAMAGSAPSININVEIKGNVIGNKEFAQQVGEDVASQIMRAWGNVK